MPASLTAYSETPDAKIEPLPPVVPKVTFDIEAGKHVKQIDFDYRAFDAMARAGGLDDRAIGNYAIHFGTYESLDELSILPAELNSLGRHFGGKKLSFIRVDNLPYADEVLALPPQEAADETAKAINRATIHETGHYVERQDGLRSLLHHLRAFTMLHASRDTLPHEKVAIQFENDHKDKKIVKTIFNI